MYAKKDNKIYKVDEISKDTYLKKGFDIVDEDGELIEASPSKTIAYSEHLKIVNDLNEKLKSTKNDLKSPDKKVQKEIDDLKLKNNELSEKLEEAEGAIKSLTNEKNELENKLNESIPVTEENSNKTDGDNNGQVQE